LRVFHFLNEEFGIKDLREKRLKISEIMSLNDPFEFLSVDLSDLVFRKAMKKTKSQLAKTNGLICFSANWKNPVQWSHYANNHKGICLGFDVADHLLTPVNYVEKRLSFENPINEEDMLQIFSTKFNHWIYEEEYRVFTELSVKEKGLFYIDFSDDLVLKQVIIGALSLITKKQILDACGSNKVDIFKARAAFKTFEIVKNQAHE
jgi:hypothetical protein